MAFVKLYKNNAYFKRFQTKYRRRREGKTDYYARKRLTCQDKDKYNTQKYRLVTRVTSGQVLCQVVYSTLQGDKVMCQANSLELKRFGLTAGLTNYSAAYATGLLCARRILKQTKLDTVYAGVAKPSGEDYNVEEETGDKQPFKAVLDIGLTYATTGNRVFGALKGAVDGGLNVPHNNQRFPGFFKDSEGSSYDAAVHKDRIMGAHVDKFMAKLKEDSNEDYLGQFKVWDACLKKSGQKSVESLMAKIHSEIRKNPDLVRKAKQSKYDRAHSKYTLRKLNAAQKQERANKKIEIAMKQKK